MARPWPRRRHPRSPAPAAIRGHEPKPSRAGRSRIRLVAHILSGAVALTLATGLATAGTTLAMNASPLPLVNTAAFVFLFAATVVSGAIVVAFWHHLLVGLAPPEAKPARARPPRRPPPPVRQRPARPLRDIGPANQQRQINNGSTPR